MPSILAYFTKLVNCLAADLLPAANCQQQAGHEYERNQGSHPGQCRYAAGLEVDERNGRWRYPAEGKAIK
jgi:hypothetical protein